MQYLLGMFVTSKDTLLLLAGRSRVAAVYTLQASRIGSYGGAERQRNQLVPVTTRLVSAGSAASRDAGVLQVQDRGAI